MSKINLKRWKEIIGDPDWYHEVLHDIDKFSDLKKENPDEYEIEKTKVLDFFELELSRNEVCLGDDMGSFDKERAPIDTIVIHHTAGNPGLTPARLSAMELLLLYAPQFDKPTYEADKKIEGQPIYSGHIREGRQIFWPYHWIIRNNGSVERLLNDNEVGWHSGKWDVNCRSVAIVIDGDYSDKKPSDVELKAIVKIIKESYPNVSKEKVVGHKEIVETICPSNIFLGPDGWKNDLLKLL